MLIKNIYKKYNNSSVLLEYKKAINISNKPCSSHSNYNCSICYPRKQVSVVANSSLIRTKTNITDIVLSNQFELFCTFTFDPKKVDSKDFISTKETMSHWLNYQKKMNQNFKYIIVPELHKSGRLHFHALISGYTGKLTKTKYKSNNKIIYNMQKWNKGFSTAIEIDKNSEKLAYYLQKYITKDMIKVTNKKRYWSSKNLSRPTVEYNVSVLEIMIPNYENEYYTIYKTIPKEYNKSYNKLKEGK